MEPNFRPLNWLSALHLGEEKWTPDFLRNDAQKRSARITIRVVGDERQAAKDVQKRLRKPRPDIVAPLRAESCQRAFDETRKQNPDALYDELSEIAAGLLHISKRQLRKYVPNPFR